MGTRWLGTSWYFYELTGTPYWVRVLPLSLMSYRSAGVLYRNYYWKTSEWFCFLQSNHAYSMMHASCNWSLSTNNSNPLWSTNAWNSLPNYRSSRDATTQNAVTWSERLHYQSGTFVSVLFLHTYRHESEWAGMESTMFGFAYANEPRQTAVSH